MSRHFIFIFGHAPKGHGDPRAGRTMARITRGRPSPNPQEHA